MDWPHINAMTCDVEDYFHVSAFNDVISRNDWEKLQCRIPHNIEKILKLFAENDVKATFFTLGWVAARHPEVVRRIADEGHEIASHGMNHETVWRQSPAQFLEDASTSRKLLEDTTGRKVTGYRAASWSIDNRTPWAHDVLAEAGYRYSSSIYPISHDHFGVPDAPVNPHLVGDSGVLEIPPSVARVLGRNLPAAGGGYFRLYPMFISTWLINRARSGNGSPFVFYFHPWEIDPEQPRVKDVRLRARIRHYLNLASFLDRLTMLVREYKWARMDKIFLESR